MGTPLPRVARESRLSPVVAQAGRRQEAALLLLQRRAYQRAMEEEEEEEVDVMRLCITRVVALRAAWIPLSLLHFSSAGTSLTVCRSLQAKLLLLLLLRPPHPFLPLRGLAPLCRVCPRLWGVQQQ